MRARSSAPVSQAVMSHELHASCMQEAILTSVRHRDLRLQVCLPCLLECLLILFLNEEVLNPPREHVEESPW